MNNAYRLVFSQTVALLDHTRLIEDYDEILIHNSIKSK